jgi:hypothetical protein
MSTPFYDLASLVVVPSGYKASKVYAQKPLTTDGQLTFSRASTATRVNASGLIETVASNVPRLDYLGSSCPRLLLEPQRTNLLTYSEQFNNTAYTKTNTTVTANAATSPDGYLNADSLLESSATGTHQIWQRPSLTSGQSYTFSAFVKTNGRRRVQLQSYDNSSTYAAAIYDVVSGTVVETNATASIQNYGNGWYRIILTGTCPTTATGYAVLNLATDSFSSATLQDSYAGDTSKGVYVYGYQQEAASYATSLIPTTTAAVTRLADACSKTGISSLIGQTEGTLFAEFVYSGKFGSASNSSMPISIDDASGNNEAYIFINGTNNVASGQFVVGGGFTCNITGLALTVGTRYKMAFAYKQNDFAFYINGALQGIDTSGNIAALPNLRVGNYFGLNYIQDTISQALLFKTRLTPAQLAEITTL